MQTLRVTFCFVIVAASLNLRTALSDRDPNSRLTQARVLSSAFQRHPRGSLKLVLGVHCPSSHYLAPSGGIPPEYSSLRQGGLVHLIRNNTSPAATLQTGTCSVLPCYLDSAKEVEAPVWTSSSPVGLQHTSEAELTLNVFCSPIFLRPARSGICVVLLPPFLVVFLQHVFQLEPQERDLCEGRISSSGICLKF